VSTLCAYSDDLLVLPSTYIANSKEAVQRPLQPKLGVSAGAKQ
jgi:hypothetical protein